MYLLLRLMKDVTKKTLRSEINDEANYLKMSEISMLIVSN